MQSGEKPNVTDKEMEKFYNELNSAIITPFFGLQKQDPKTATEERYLAKFDFGIPIRRPQPITLVSCVDDIPRRPNPIQEFLETLDDLEVLLKQTKGKFRRNIRRTLKKYKKKIIDCRGAKW